MTAADHTGAPLLKLVVRLVAATNAEAPAKSVDEATAAKRVAAKLGGRRLILWTTEHAAPLLRWAKDGGNPVTFSARDTLSTRLPAWRGVVDRTGTPVRECLPPGRADRLYVATARMADTTDTTEHRDWLTTGRGATVVDVTGDQDAALRIHAMLRAVGVVVDDTEPAPVASRTDDACDCVCSVTATPPPRKPARPEAAARRVPLLQVLLAAARRRPRAETSVELSRLGRRPPAPHPARTASRTTAPHSRTAFARRTALAHRIRATTRTVAAPRG